MSNNIEDQIVSMQFDNKQFESGVATSLGTIDKLNQSLQFKNGVSGISEINRAAAGMNLNPIAAGIQGINKAWLGMTTIAVTALGNITNKAVDAGLRMGKALTIDPIKEGFQNYETKINAVQTILANTADQGVKLKDVTKNLNELNTYANKTVYNFSEMAKNIGTFTAAGVDLKTSTASIKGIANLAALSGSTSAQASSAMYQLSQAIAAGQVHLQDWNSVVNAGIGGAAFQKNLIQSALATGTLDKSQVHLGKTMADTTINGVAFRQSLTPPPGGTSWLTSGVLTKSLGTFTGDLTKAQLVAQGFTKDQAKAILAQGKRARNAATQIKTFTQLFQALKEEVGTAYASVFEALFGNINQAKKFLSPLHKTIENALTNPIYAVADALKAWRKAGGFDDLIAIFKNLGTIVGNLLAPFKLLFGLIVPSSKNAGKGLEGFTKTIAELTGWIAKLTTPIKTVSTRFGTFGLLVEKLRVPITAFFHALKPVIPLLDQLGSKIGAMFDQGASIAGNLIKGWIYGLDAPEMEKAAVKLAHSWISAIENALGIHSPATTMIPIGENIVRGIVQGLISSAQLLIKGAQQIFLSLGKAMKWAVQNISYQDVLQTINSGLFLGLVLIFRNFVKVFGGTMKQFQTLMGQGGEVLDQIKDNLKTMQQQVRAKIVKDIAISVALLAASAIVLSSVDSGKLKASLAAIGGLMIALVGSMRLLTGGSGKKMPDGKTIAKQSAQLTALGAALIEFSTAILIMTGAVALMGQLDTKTIEKGLAGVTGVIAVVTAATAILGKTGGGGTIFATASAMIVLAAALTAFVGVMKLYEKLDLKTIANGGGKAALVIAAIGLAMRSFGKGAIGGSVGLVIASAALVILAKALQMLAKIGLGDMIKAVLALSFVLGELAAAALAMSAAEGGAGSMIVMAAAIIILAKALQIIAAISIGNIVKAIVALTVVLALIAGAAILLAPAVPLIAALGTAVLLLGAAALAAGLGVLAFATGMGILAVVGPAAFQALSDGIDVFLQKLPQIGEAIGGFLVSILTGIVKAAGPLAKAIGKLVGILIDELTKLIPKGKHLLQTFINACIDVIVHSYAHAAKAIIGFVLVLLQKLDDAVPKLIRRGTNLIIAIIQGLGKASVRIANATGQAILDFLNGLDKAVKKYAPQIRNAGLKLAHDMIDGMTGGLLSYGEQQVRAAAEQVASHLPGWMKKVLHISSPSKVMRDEVGKWAALGVAEGLDKHSKSVQGSATDLANKSVDAMRVAFNNTKKAGNGLIDVSPKITPVLDLSQLERDASQIGSKLGNHSVTADVSRRTARSIATDEMSRRRHADKAAGGDTYNFEQNIYSPKPVDRVRVYRSTKSQLAFHREVTGK